MTSDEKAKRIDAWNVILEFLKNVNASKLQEFNFDLKRELRQNDIYNRGFAIANKSEVTKEFIEFKCTIDHDIEG